MIDKLKTWRKANRYSQQETADFIGTSRAYYAQLESGAQQLSDSMRLKIEAFLNEQFQTKNKQSCSFCAAKDEEIVVLKKQLAQKEAQLDRLTIANQSLSTTNADLHDQLRGKGSAPAAS